MGCSPAYLNAITPTLKVVNCFLYRVKIRALNITLPNLIRMLLAFPALMM